MSKQELFNILVPILAFLPAVLVYIRARKRDDQDEQLGWFAETREGQKQFIASLQQDNKELRQDNKELRQEFEDLTDKFNGLQREVNRLYRRHGEGDTPPKGIPIDKE